MNIFGGLNASTPTVLDKIGKDQKVADG